MKALSLCLTNDALRASVRRRDAGAAHAVLLLRRQHIPSKASALLSGSGSFVHQVVQLGRYSFRFANATLPEGFEPPERRLQKQGLGSFEGSGFCEIRPHHRSLSRCCPASVRSQPLRSGLPGPSAFVGLGFRTDFVIGLWDDGMRFGMTDTDLGDVFQVRVLLPLDVLMIVNCP